MINDCAAETLRPWYCFLNQTDTIMQGDIIEDCRVLHFLDEDEVNETLRIQWVSKTVVVLSQSCDLVKGREKSRDVLLCTLWDRPALVKGHLSTLQGMEDARRGNMPGVHLLAPCDLPDWQRPERVADFRQLHTLPLEMLRSTCAKSKRIRLMSPYREHLSQAFARFFMRVGLPVDIKPYVEKSKKTKD